MTEKPTHRRETPIRFDSYDAMPPATPVSPAFKILSDDEIERRAAADPDAGTIPPGFWDKAVSVDTENGEQITLRLDADVLQHFRSTGEGYGSRINAVLRSYVRAVEKAR